MKIKKRFIPIFLLACLSLAACADKGDSKSSSSESSVSDSSSANSSAADNSAADSSSDAGEAQHATAAEQEIGFPGMVPIYPGGVKDGEYDIKVDSSSSMFKITACKLTVSAGEMTAAMTMSGTGYEYLFMGSEQDAAASDESHYIKYEEKDGAHVFTVPVAALNQEIECAAFSTKKQEWYGRRLVFRGDGLSADALTESKGTSLDSLKLEDGNYTMDVALEGGSGKAGVDSPCNITVKDGKATALLVWSSDKYDYMIVDDKKYDAVIKDGASTFEIPVSAFDTDLHVKADTTAMSTPHEIEYALYFDSATLDKE